jgi:hypothetical protein
VRKDKDFITAHLQLHKRRGKAATRHFRRGNGATP